MHSRDLAWRMPNFFNSFCYFKHLRRDSLVRVCPASPETQVIHERGGRGGEMASSFRQRLSFPLKFCAGGLIPKDPSRE